MLAEFAEILKSPDFEEYLCDFHSEVGHGDSDFFEPSDEDQDIYDDLDGKFKKFKSVFNPTFENGKLLLWREIKAAKVKTTHAGTSWTWDKDFAHSPWGSGDNSIILKGLADKDAVDMSGTLACALYDIDGGIAAEREIRLKQGAKIELLEPTNRIVTACVIKTLAGKYKYKSRKRAISL